MPDVPAHAWIDASSERCDSDVDRLSYTACRARLLQRIAEPEPARIQLLSGPRQVGKNTLLLEEAFLIAGLEKHFARALRRRAARPKLVTLSNALLAAVDPRGLPDPAHELARFGAWVENACPAFAWNSGQRMTYWRVEPFEVDACWKAAGDRSRSR